MDFSATIQQNIAISRRLDGDPAMEYVFVRIRELAEKC